MTMTTRTLCTLALLLAATGTLAQQVYRQIGPGGRVTFSDQPPAANARKPRSITSCVVLRIGCDIADGG